VLWDYLRQCFVIGWTPSKDVTHTWNNLAVPLLNLVATVGPVPVIPCPASPPPYRAAARRRSCESRATWNTKRTTPSRPG
jgi:hypothetical protein